MWRAMRWTWAMYRWLINTRAAQAYILHVLLTKEAQAKWDAEMEAAREDLLAGPKSQRMRQLWTQPTYGEATMEAKLKIEKVRGPRPTALSHKLFRLDIVYGLFGVPERGSHVGPRGRGRPSKKRPASGAGASSSTPGVLDSPDRAAKRKEAGGYRWKGGGGGASTVKKSKTTTGAGKSRRVHEYPEVTLAAGAGLPNERFDQINDLHTHAAWDFVDKNSVRGAGIGSKSRHRCQICSAVGPIWHGKYRGGTLAPRRALVMCSGPRCPRAYCSLACYNLWHRNQEMPDIGAAAAGESRR